MIHNRPLPKNCYKVSVDKSLQDAACIPEIGGNGFKTVTEAVGGFYAWPKEKVILEDQVHTHVFYQPIYTCIYNFSYSIQYLIHPACCFLQATPPSSIQMISEHNKVPPKLTGKRTCVSIEAVKSEAAQKMKTQKSLDY